MANKIAEAFIEISTRGLEKARRQFKRFGNTAEQETKKTKRGLDNALGGAEKFQSTLGKLLIPVGVATSLAGIINQFGELINRGREFERALRQIDRNAQAITDTLINGNRETDEQIVSQKQLLQQYNANKRAVEDTIKEFEKGESAVGALARGIASLFTDVAVTQEEQVRAAEDQIDRLTQKFNEQRKLLTQTQERERKKQEKEEVDRIIREMQAKMDADMKARDLERAERRKAEQERVESARRVAEQIAEANAAAFASAAQQAAESFSAALSGGAFSRLEDLVQQAATAAQDISRKQSRR